MKNRIINVQDVEISISKQDLDDYICIIFALRISQKQNQIQPELQI